MNNQNTFSKWAEKTRQMIPGLKSLQILSKDGLSLYSNAIKEDQADQLAALNALLHSGAQQMSRQFTYLNKAHTSDPIAIHLANSIYLIMAINENYLMGLHLSQNQNISEITQSLRKQFHSHTSEGCLALSA